LARRNFPGVFDQSLSGRVCAKLELFDIAADAFGWFIRIKSDLDALARLPQKTGRRFRIRVADEKYRVLRVFDQSARKNIRERIWNHHPAGKDICAPRTQQRIAYGFIIQNERRCFPHELQARQLSTRRMRAPIINIGELRTESADINGKLSSKRSEEHTSELQSRGHLVCRLLLEKKNLIRN